MMSLGWALIQHGWGPFKTRELGSRPQEGTGSRWPFTSQADRSGRNQLCWHLDFRLLAARILRKFISVVKPSCLWHFIKAVLVIWYDVLQEEANVAPKGRTAIQKETGGWLRRKESTCQETQETQVRSLVQEEPTPLRTTKPVWDNHWACALEPRNPGYWSPSTLGPELPDKRSRRSERPGTAAREWPLLVATKTQHSPKKCTHK